MFTYLINLIIYIILFSNNLSVSAEIVDKDTIVSYKDFKVTFFNVGQGNCTLVECPNGPPLLMDAGSSCYPIINPSNNMLITPTKLHIINNIAKKTSPSLERWKKINPSSSEYPDLNVIVSHADKDHTNMLGDILKNLYYSSPAYQQGFKITLLCGGHKEHYSNFIKEISKITKLKILNTKTYVSDFKNSEEVIGIEMQNLFYCGNAHLTILSAELSKVPTESKSDKTNEHSIVIKISYHDKSIILTGDATGNNTKKIIEQNKKTISVINNQIDQLKLSIAKIQNNINILNIQKTKYLLALNKQKSSQTLDPTIIEALNEAIDKTNKEITNIEESESNNLFELKEKEIELANKEKELHTDILQASHHGANSDKSNNLEWFDATQPTILVISSGIYENFNHPKSEIIENFLKSKRKRTIFEDKIYHNVHAHKKIRTFHNIPQFSNSFHSYLIFSGGYSLSITKLGIYNTIDQGDISFYWINAQDPVLIDYEGRLAEFSNPFNNPVSKTLKALSITQPNPLIDDKRGAVILANLFNLQITSDNLADIARFCKNFPSLINLNLSHNPLIKNKIEDIKKLIYLIEQNPNLNSIGLNEIGDIEADARINLLLSWQNRGLNLDPLPSANDNNICGACGQDLKLLDGAASLAESLSLAHRSHAASNNNHHT